MIYQFAILIISLLIMIWACDYAIQNSTLLGKIFGVSDIFMGIFVISIGTSLPEFAATVQAIKLGAPGIVAGNLIGSNIANILLVVGVMLLPIKVYNIENKNKISLHYFLFISLLFSLILFFNITLTNIFILFIIILLSIFIVIEFNENQYDKKDKDQKKFNYLLIVLKILISFIFLYFSSDYFVRSAQNISINFGISESVVGISIIALGTSLPEVLTTIIALYRKQKHLALGNIIGSCVANITLISLIAIILGGSINYFLLLENISKIVFLTTSLMFYLIFFFNFANRATGVFFLLLYIIYILTLYK